MQHGAEIRAVFLQIGEEAFRRLRSAEQIALRDIAAAAAQKGGLVKRFDAFGDGLVIEAGRHRQNGFNQHGRVTIFAEAFDELPIDFERVKGQTG